DFRASVALGIVAHAFLPKQWRQRVCEIGMWTDQSRFRRATVHQSLEGPRTRWRHPEPDLEPDENDNCADDKSHHTRSDLSEAQEKGPFATCSLIGTSCLQIDPLPPVTPKLARACALDMRCQHIGVKRSGLR